MNAEDKNIDNLLIAYLNDELCNEDVKVVERWIGASENNQRIFNEVVDLWQTSIATEPIQVNTERGWDRIEKRVSSKSSLLTKWQGIAATAIILIGSAIAYLTYGSAIESTILLANNQFENDTLVDGSIVKLNSNSSLVFSNDFNKEYREVKLEGEAFFEIHRDTQKTFIISLGEAQVKVLGTSFNIKSFEESEFIEVYVKSGLVAFEYIPLDSSQSYISIQLKAGEKIFYDKTNHRIRKANDRSINNLDTYWRDNKLEFDRVRLGKVAEIVDVIYEVEIAFSDSSAKNCLLTVTFNDASIDEVVEVIANTFNFEIEQQNENYLIIGKGCEKP